MLVIADVMESWIGLRLCAAAREVNTELVITIAAMDEIASKAGEHLLSILTETSVS